MYSFGSGVLFGTRTDIANATPVNFGLVQEVTIEETASIKELTGQYQRPVAMARGTIKTTGKAKVARISGLAFASLFYGVTPTTGQLATSFAEAAAVPGASPYTVSVVNASTWVKDLGVLYAATGLPLLQVASARPRANIRLPPASTHSPRPIPERLSSSAITIRSRRQVSSSP